MRVLHINQGIYNEAVITYSNGDITSHLMYNLYRNRHPLFSSVFILESLLICSVNVTNGVQ